jgi:hypothetical protein
VPEQDINSIKQKDLLLDVLQNQERSVFIQALSLLV